MLTHRKPVRGLVLAGLLTIVGGIAPSIAFAGGCPADKIGANPLTDAATMPAGVTDTVLTLIDLSKETVNLDDRLFRLRRLEIEPNGVVPLHSHADRPALIYIVSGAITEYNSNCTVPIVHKAGESAMESIGLTHWWRNTGRETVVLLSADLLHTKKDDGRTM